MKFAFWIATENGPILEVIEGPSLEAALSAAGRGREGPGVMRESGVIEFGDDTAFDLSVPEARAALIRGIGVYALRYLEVEGQIKLSF